ncbi:transposase [Azospirillaceae bacterium]
MSDNRRISERNRTDLVPWPDSPVGRVDSARPGQKLRTRIPTLQQLASLLIDGILVLPRNYRRGMFLDILV